MEYMEQQMQQQLESSMHYEETVIKLGKIMTKEEKNLLLEGLSIEASRVMDRAEWSIVIKSKDANGDEYEREIGNK